MTQKFLAFSRLKSLPQKHLRQAMTQKTLMTQNPLPSSPLPPSLSPLSPLYIYIFFSPPEKRVCVICVFCVIPEKISPSKIRTYAKLRCPKFCVIFRHFASFASLVTINPCQIRTYVNPF